MKLSESQERHFNLQYEFLRSRIEEEGVWHDMFDYGGDTKWLSVEHRDGMKTFTLLLDDNYMGACSSDDREILKGIVEYLLDGDIKDIPEEYLL